MFNFIKFKSFLTSIMAAQLVSPVLGYPQTRQINGQPMWKEARESAAKGTRVRVPKGILHILEKQYEDDLDQPGDPCNRKEFEKMDAFRVELNPRSVRVGIVVWPRNSCLCGATGNCQFWVFVSKNGHYRSILEAGMVRDFGFLKLTTNGRRDLVVWSHDSAQRSPARLFQFNGKEYLEACGWEEDYELKELPDGRWVSAGDPKIVSSTCEQLPSSEEPRP